MNVQQSSHQTLNLWDDYYTEKALNRSHNISTVHFKITVGKHYSVQLSNVDFFIISLINMKTHGRKLKSGS